MIFTESIDLEPNAHLFFIEKFRYIELHSEENGLLGKFEVWHDYLAENREYIVVNNGKLYLDTILQQ